MQITNVNYNLKVTNLDEFNKLLSEARTLADQLREKQEQICQWEPAVSATRLDFCFMESTLQYLRALVLFNLHRTDHSELVDEGLLDAESLMPTAKAHAFIDNTTNKERWLKVKSNADSLEKAIQLADLYAREEIGLL